MVAFNVISCGDDCTKPGTGIGIYDEFDVVPSVQRARGLCSRASLATPNKGVWLCCFVGVTLCRAGQRTPLLAPNVPGVKGGRRGGHTHFPKS